MKPNWQDGTGQRMAECHKKSNIRRIEEGGDLRVITKDELVAIETIRHEMEICRHKWPETEAGKYSNARRTVDAMLLRFTGEETKP